MNSKLPHLPPLNRARINRKSQSTTTMTTSIVNNRHSSSHVHPRPSASLRIHRPLFHIPLPDHSPPYPYEKNFNRPLIAPSVRKIMPPRASPAPAQPSQQKPCVDPPNPSRSDILCDIFVLPIARKHGLSTPHTPHAGSKSGGG